MTQGPHGQQGDRYGSGAGEGRPRAFPLRVTDTQALDSKRLASQRVTAGRLQGTAGLSCPLGSHVQDRCHASSEWARGEGQEESDRGGRGSEAAAGGVESISQEACMSGEGARGPREGV